MTCIEPDLSACSRFPGSAPASIGAPTAVRKPPVPGVVSPRRINVAAFLSELMSAAEVAEATDKGVRS